MDPTTQQPTPVPTTQPQPQPIPAQPVQTQPEPTQPSPTPPPVLNKEANKKSLFLIIGIIILVIILVTLSALLLMRNTTTSNQVGSNSLPTQQSLPQTVTPTSAPTATQSSDLQDASQVDTGDPTQDITSVTQDASNL